MLNEVDMGMKRSEYRDVARELAAALHMNYAYGVEFVEVDPIFALGTEQVHLPKPRSRMLDCNWNYTSITNATSAFMARRS